MKEKTLLPYILGILMLSIILILIECYFAAAFIFLISIAIIVLISCDKNEQSKKSSNQHTKSNPSSRRNWNGFSDPNDLPTDGYDNNGW